LMAPRRLTAAGQKPGVAVNGADGRPQRLMKLATDDRATGQKPTKAGRSRRRNKNKKTIDRTAVQYYFNI